MATELRTLKDIFGKNPIDEEHLCKPLKAEAIKWFHRSDGNKHKFIREFFNITQQDLNDALEVNSAQEKKEDTRKSNNTTFK